MAKSNTGIRGVAHLALYDENGDLKLEVVKNNLITTHGDEYYAKQAIAGVDGNTAPTLVAGMQLGTGTTPAAKSGAASTIETFIANSGVAFDPGSVDPSAVGSDVGWKVRYTCTWGAGVATNSAITEAVITEQTDGNTPAVASDTISRVVFTAINKGASDTLVLNWDHIFYDAV